MLVADRNIHISGKLPIQLEIARIHSQTVQFSQLVTGSHHYDVFPPDTLYYLRGKLFVSSAKDEAIAAYRRYDDFPCFILLEQSQHCMFAQVRSHQLPFKNRSLNFSGASMLSPAR